MKVALSTDMHPDVDLDQFSGKAGVKLQPFPETGGINYLVLATDFRTLEEALPHLKKARKVLRGEVLGPLEVHVSGNGAGEFISLAEYAVRLERIVVGISSDDLERLVFPRQPSR